MEGNIFIQVFTDLNTAEIICNTCCLPIIRPVFSEKTLPCTCALSLNFYGTIGQESLLVPGWTQPWVQIGTSSLHKP